jgi:AraC family transcriptional regulator of adaptative response/methylated-DNA-[protein]-cysteine methyltransferase
MKSVKKRGTIYISEISTPIGNMVAGASGDGLHFLEFTDTKDHSARRKLNDKFSGTDFIEGENDQMVKLKKELGDYFEGNCKKFSVPLVLSGTEFQKRVWLKLSSIPYGHTISYNDLAESISSIDSARAVANANARNRLAIIVPCHRVIGENGKLTGYAGGLWRKRWLLDHERKYSGQPVSLELF